MDAIILSDHTIFAVASGSVRGAITILRLSGPASAPILRTLCGSLPPPRRASLRSLFDAQGELLDRAIVLWTPGPGSYTGEDACELHLHGGRAVTAGVCTALVGLGARPAEPGEFTRRAVLHGRMDLLAAEGIADLVAAETAMQRRQALAQAGGGMSRIVQGWSDRLRLLVAEQEALIDFPDEDLPAAVAASQHGQLQALSDEMQGHLARAPMAERVREGLLFVVAGPPNVGKSTLVNGLLGREMAIVTPRPGTTRDLLEAQLDLGGIAVTLVDTAGLRASDDEAEVEGIARARASLERADLVVQVMACGGHDDADGGSDEAYPATALRVANKADLGPAPAGWLAVSARSRHGLDQLRGHLEAAATRLTQGGGGESLTRERHRAAVSEAVARLAAAAGAGLPELRAEELRLALQALGRLTGRVGVEEILDTIFARFCIGK